MVPYGPMYRDMSIRRLPSRLLLEPAGSDLIASLVSEQRALWVEKLVLLFASRLPNEPHNPDSTKQESR